MDTNIEFIWVEEGGKIERMEHIEKREKEES